MIRNSSKDHNADIYPSLHTILEEKNKCYPSQIEFTETSAKCNLQQMCEHTLSRVIKMVDFDKIQSDEADLSGTFYLKCGMDGASSQSIYMQKFETTDLGSVEASSEETLFQTAIVPLKLIVGGKAVWTNEKPNSTHFCRPLHLQYMKETVEVTKNEKEWIDTSVEN